jgi:hypothetical protein
MPHLSDDAVLNALGTELERLGYVVVPHGAEGICVRLPLFASVRIRRDGERFRFTPKFGALGRTSSLMVTSGVSAAVFGGVAIALGAAPLTLLVGFVGFTGLAHDACRFVLTEGCLTRLQQVITTSQAVAAAEQSAALAPGAAPAQLSPSQARPALADAQRRR